MADGLNRYRGSGLVQWPVAAVTRVAPKFRLQSEHPIADLHLCTAVVRSRPTAAGGASSGERQVIRKSGRHILTGRAGR